MKKITPEEMEEAEHIAREWNNTQPPPEVQAKYVHIYPYFQCSWQGHRAAEKKGQQFTREYAEHMWKQCGTWVVVMVAWKDRNGKVMAGMWVDSKRFGLQ